MIYMSKKSRKYFEKIFLKQNVAKFYFALNIIKHDFFFNALARGMSNISNNVSNGTSETSATADVSKCTEKGL